LLEGDVEGFQGFGRGRILGLLGEFLVFLVEELGADLGTQGKEVFGSGLAEGLSAMQVAVAFLDYFLLEGGDWQFLVEGLRGAGALCEALA
jgi:hypothetical protein